MDQSKFDDLTRGLASETTRRRIFRGVAAVVAGGVGLTAAGSAVAKRGKKGVRAQGKGKGQEKVEICHKPGTPAEKTLTVAAPAVKAHLAHGDTLGACDDGSICAGADACGDTAGRECGTDRSGTDCFCGSTVDGGDGCFLGDQNNCGRRRCRLTDDNDDNNGCADGEACVAAASCCGRDVCIPLCNPVA